MDVIAPTKEQFKAFRDLPRDEPIHMLNFLKYKDRATYGDDIPEGFDPDVTGKEAYQRYKDVFLGYLHARGGRMVWEGRADQNFIGAQPEWDDLFIAYYPAGQDFIDMQFDPIYQPSLVHRTAGLFKSDLIRCAPK